MIDFLNNILNLEDKIINIEFINFELPSVTVDNSLIKNSKNRKKKKENEERKNSGNNENIICNENKNGKSGRMDVLVQNLRQLNMKTKYNKTESKSNYNYLYRDKEIVMVTETKNYEFIIIEIQFPKTGNMLKKSLFHVSGTIFHSLSSRKKYEEIPNVILINILNYNLFIDPEDMEQCHWIFEVAERNTKKGKGFEDLIKFHFIELSKFKNESNETMKKQFPWILFLLDPNNNYFRTEKTPTCFLKARGTLYELSKDKYIRESNKQITKHWSDIKLVAYNGFKDGFKDDGFKDGKIEGKNEGTQLKSIEVAMTGILASSNIYCFHNLRLSLQKIPVS
ncbi:hypothetical protein BCR32DRAFT_138226 [Anaeromyces robustus]|uniref:Uncharacterized protein n=1 Tax=Anaeromyces robustus TaxID=1754192 RepID=A0A1Y1VQT2_9FUNG|nr:hypothetical protein BCR32DRAFT_138226 [Anaeromyces robustus]|eukprot:ORX63630.1 hypothetical protein BCR32DRAFT_138226 [Anaeromyces robustus]